jgi:hypothetical protein
MYIFLLTALSRCLKSIPGDDESKSLFLVGVDSGTNAYIIIATFDNETKKLTTNEVVNFEDIYKGEKIISEVLAIYTFSSSEELNEDVKNIFVQVFNQTENKYQLKIFSHYEGKFELKDFDVFSSQNVFE